MSSGGAREKAAGQGQETQRRGLRPGLARLLLAVAVLAVVVAVTLGHTREVNRSEASLRTKLTLQDIDHHVAYLRKYLAEEESLIMAGASAREVRAATFGC